jgi:succinoglycan biosynthesis protein ExoM
MTIAVCICTYLRPESLQRLLDVLSGMEFGTLDPHDVFIVVVDNRPGGRAREICNQALKSLPVTLYFVEEPTPGISFARNRAISTALARSAEFIAFLDDDDLPRPDWLVHLVDRQRVSGADLVTGIWQLPDNLTIPGSLSTIKFLRPPEFDSLNRWGSPHGAATCNVLIGRAVVEHLARTGPVFRPEFALTGGGDTDFFIRARAAGFSVVVATDSVVFRTWDAARLTWLGVLRRAFRMGSTSMHLDRAHTSAIECECKYREARNDLVRTIILLPCSLLRPKKFVKRLSRIACSLGVLHAHSGRRYDYYD